MDADRARRCKRCGSNNGGELPDDVMLSILELNCDNIEAEIYRIEIAIDYYNDTIKELEIFTDEDYDSDYDDEEDHYELDNQLLQDEIYFNNLSSNI